MKVYERNYIEEHLTYPVCIELMKKALADLAGGKSRQIVRTGMGLPKGALAMMPCYLGGSGCFGVKIISVYPRNAADGYPSHQGYVLLFDEAHGEAVAIADADTITEIRTACASAAATDLLARKDAKKLAIIGSGTQARSHLRAMLCVRDIESVTVTSFHRDHAEAFAANMQAECPVPIRVVDTVEEAVKDADIVCSVSRSREPIIRGEWIPEGCHVNAVGTCSPVSREADSALVARSKLYVDQIEACKAESGEYLIPLKEGLITEDHIKGSIGDLVLGKVKGRESETEITLFDSLGLAVEDVICADYLYRADQ